MIQPVPKPLLVLALAAPAPASSEVYTWTDERGRVHMTDDLSRVPEAHRREAAQARRRAITAPREWNAVGPGKASGAEPSSAAGTRVQEKEDKARVHVLGVERAGAEMRVTAELDGGTRAPFIVDTGAMLNTMPAWVAEEMGFAFDEDTPSTVVRGISGKPMMVPIVTVGSVRIGGAQVDDVDFAVLATQRRGLLGMPFFNHFKVSTDPTRGTLTLEEIDLDGVEGVYGGQNEQAWRRDFRFLNHMLEQVEQYREGLPTGIAGYEDAFEKLDQMERYWEAQLEALELKASRAGVPRAWRE